MAWVRAHWVTIFGAAALLLGLVIALVGYAYKALRDGVDR